MCAVHRLRLVTFYTCFCTMALIAGSINTLLLGDHTKDTDGPSAFLKDLQNRKHLLVFQNQLFEDNPPRNYNKKQQQEKETDRSAIKVKLIHRSSLNPASPLSRKTANRTEILEQVLRMDRQRVTGIKQNLRRMLAKSAPTSSLPPALPQASPVQRTIEAAATPTQETGELTSFMISGSSVGSGEYFVELDVGTPPQRLFFIVDTGSDLTWTKCSSNKSCSQSNQTFNSNNSSSFRPVSCRSEDCQIVSSLPYCRDTSDQCYFSESYSDKSFTSGILMSETVTLRSHSGKPTQLDNLTMGCATESAGSNFIRVGGVVGLGQGSLSFSSQVGPAYGNKFSYCFVDFFSPTTVGSSLVFGESSFEHPLQYIPLLKNPYLKTYYYVGVEGVKVNGTLLPIPDHAWEIDSYGNGGTILDSGTTITQFEETAYETILAAFESAISYQRTAATNGLELCYNITLVSNPVFPELLISFQGNATFQPPQDNYFIDAAKGVKCLAVQGVNSTSGISVIGNLLQQNFYMEYDRHNDRIGFVATNCSAIAAS
eukprot:c22028_g1_i1 orf=653-2275(+)